MLVRDLTAVVVALQRSPLITGSRINNPHVQPVREFRHVRRYAHRMPARAEHAFLLRSRTLGKMADVT